MNDSFVRRGNAAIHEQNRTRRKMVSGASLPYGAAALVLLGMLAAFHGAAIKAFATGVPGGGAAQAERPANTIIVHSMFGGQIFGFDIDQTGTEGLLSEDLTLANGNVLAAVETFDQRTGKILKVVAETQTMDNFVTQGIVGDSVGLIEYEHVAGFLDVKRHFPILNPLQSNKFTGLWKPPIGTKHIVEEVSHNQGTPNSAVFALDVSGQFMPYVFGSNVARNTFGPLITLTNDNFNSGAFPAIALNTTNNVAVLGHATLGNPFAPPMIGLANLTKGTFSAFTGVGTGDVNGIAVDSADGIACTSTEIDFSVQFYDLATQTGFSEVLPGATQQIYSGADVEYDAIHKLFLVAQPVSSTSPSGSSIQVYDTSGNFVESINGLSFSNASNVIPVYIALHPSARAGYVDGPDSGVTELQSFTY